MNLSPFKDKFLESLAVFAPFVQLRVTQSKNLDLLIKYRN